MGLIRDDTGRLHIDTPLMAESLMDKALLDRTDTGPVFRPLPKLNVVKLGGQSVIDRAVTRCCRCWMRSWLHGPATRSWS